MNTAVTTSATAEEETASFAYQWTLAYTGTRTVGMHAAWLIVCVIRLMGSEPRSQL